MDDLAFIEKLKKHIMNALGSMTLQTILENLSRNEKLIIPANLVDPSASPHATMSRESHSNLLEDLKKIEFKNLCKVKLIYLVMSSCSLGHGNTYSNYASIIAFGHGQLSSLH